MWVLVIMSVVVGRGGLVTSERQPVGTESPNSRVRVCACACVRGDDFTLLRHARSAGKLFARCACTRPICRQETFAPIIASVILLCKIPAVRQYKQFVVWSLRSVIALPHSHTIQRITDHPLPSHSHTSGDNGDSHRNYCQPFSGSLITPYPHIHTILGTTPFSGSLITPCPHIHTLLGTTMIVTAIIISHLEDPWSPLPPHSHTSGDNSDSHRNYCQPFSGSLITPYPHIHTILGTTVIWITDHPLPSHSHNSGDYSDSHPNYCQPFSGSLITPCPHTHTLLGTTMLVTAIIISHLEDPWSPLPPHSHTSGDNSDNHRNYCQPFSGSLITPYPHIHTILGTTVAWRNKINPLLLACVLRNLKELQTSIT
ncbi:hypothetical protein J6590_040483 [Homalodisca vitripennis]|nr:hypothetical protein J6590_040483 [Homalodisca vitripennis]